MMKVLFAASIAKHINGFHIPYLRFFKEEGYEVHTATKGEEEIPYVDVKHEVAFERSPFSTKNFAAYRELKNIISENDFDLIHCHTPVASILTRLAARRARKKGTKVLYTAHGFHFYKGAPLLNWLLYYPIEKLMARFTDVLITINEEDYGRAKKFKAKKVYHIPGMGVDCDKIAQAENKREEFRKELQIPEDAFVILSVGELNVNKNHKVILEAIGQIPNEKIYYVICGKGGQKENLEIKAAEFGFSDRLKLVGWQPNVSEWLSVADAFAFPSIREGLGLAALEAMAAGLPIITSDAGGIKEYSEDGKTGFACSADDTAGFAKALLTLKENEAMRKEMSEYNRRAVQKFDVKNVEQILKEIYRGEM
ncbi:MAG: glycosyltransferase family 4 protein [Clostridia bacterium]|nr:glycosyltransferase family 4 protein [Clostridia bacterium]